MAALFYPDTMTENINERMMWGEAFWAKRDQEMLWCVYLGCLNPWGQRLIDIQCTKKSSTSEPLLFDQKVMSPFPSCQGPQESHLYTLSLPFWWAPLLCSMGAPQQEPSYIPVHTEVHLQGWWDQSWGQHVDQPGDLEHHPKEVNQNSASVHRPDLQLWDPRKAPLLNRR